MKLFIAISLFVGSLFLAATNSSSALNSATEGPGLAVTPSITSVASGSEHTCILRDAAVWCSGSNTRGQLGTGTLINSSSFIPSLIADATMVAVGGTTSCAVRADTSLWCWGTMITVPDPLSLSPTTRFADSATPVQIPINGVRSVAVGMYHSCANLVDDSVWCWGKNTRGQLGNNTQIDSIVPVRALMSSVISVDVGTAHTCAVRRTGSVWCWGTNSSHQLGLRFSTPRLRPTSVPKIRATSVTSGDAFNCIMSTSVKIQCWGSNKYGQLGVTAGSSRMTPVNSAVKNPLTISAGSEFLCITTAESATWCRGRNKFSQLANGSYIAKTRFQRIVTALPLDVLTTVSAGSSHACALASSSPAMWCWGLGAQGQLGDGGSGSTGKRSFGTAIWPNGARMKAIGTDEVARIVAAGDIACDANRRVIYGSGPEGFQCGDVATATLITSLNPQAVLALGDLQYEGASLPDLQANYDLSWGLLRSITYPIRGNHEYQTAGANGYTQYFGAMSPSYWATDAGGWRIIAVDSWCQGQLFEGCSATSPQTLWLQSELLRARTDNRCAAVIMHHPVVSSGRFGTPSTQFLWQSSVAGGADLVLAAHDHIYERFAPLDATGAPAENGVPLFINGLGGATVHSIGEPVPGSQFRTNTNHGVLSLTLTPRTFEWGFISALDSSVLDQGSAPCVP